MTQLNFTVNGQSIEGDFMKPLEIASDTIGLVDCTFTFEGYDWNNLDYIQAIFESTGHYKCKKGQLLDEEGSCAIPWENMTDKSMVRVNLVGGSYVRVNDEIQFNDDGTPQMETRITTFKIDCVNVKQKVNISSTISKVNTPSIYEQFVATYEVKLKEMEERISSLESILNN